MRKLKLSGLQCQRTQHWLIWFTLLLMPGYLVNVSSLDAPAGPGQLFNLSSSFSSVSVSNLSTSITYSCTITAYNSAGVSVQSAVVYGTPEHRLPQSVTGVHGVSVEQTRWATCFFKLLQTLARAHLHTCTKHAADHFCDVFLIAYARDASARRLG